MRYIRIVHFGHSASTTRAERWSYEQIQTEHTFLHQLCEAGLSVAGPLDLPHNNTIGQLASIYFAFFERVPGRTPEEFSEEHISSLGSHLARSHNIGAHEDTPNRPTLKPHSYGPENLTNLLEHNIVLPDYRENYQRSAELIRESY